MNKYEMKMIEEMAHVLCNKRCEDCVSVHGIPCVYKSYCTRLYNAGCRKIADNEMVVNAYQLHNEFKKYEQETARAILKKFYNYLRHPLLTKKLALRFVEDLANELEIELDNTTYSEENNDD